MKRKLWLALSAVVATAAVGVGTSFALFSASVHGTQDFTSGTLCLTSERDDGDTVPGPMFYVTAAQGQTPSGVDGAYPTGVWAPGDVRTRTLTIYNPASCSSMGAWLTTVQASVHPGGYLPMANKLYVELWTPHFTGGGNVLEKVGEGYLTDFLSGAVPIHYSDGSKIPMQLTSNRHMEFRVRFDRDADNSYQDKTLVVDFTVNAEQMPHNP